MLRVLYHLKHMIATMTTIIPIRSTKMTPTPAFKLEQSHPFEVEPSKWTYITSCYEYFTV